MGRRGSTLTTMRSQDPPGGPRARRRDVIVRAVGDETLVYDEVTHEGDEALIQ